VADFYQGTELWDLSFVDPDNRRQVNFAKRSQTLEDLKRLEAQDRPELLRALLRRWHDGRVKLYLTYKLANFRRAFPELMIDGDYLPLEVSGELGDRLCAFARRSGAAWAVAVAPRLIGAAVFRGATPLDEAFWRSTVVHLPPEAPECWTNIVTGAHTEALDLGEKKVLPVKSVIKDFPVALWVDTGAAEEPVLSEERSSAPSFQSV
jgi:(1->4)-alpha-D-glucan 1-alpha-D-glucosylmutase